ncbi:hypothetical protein [Methylobacterium tarhaniae]|uniref:hypothetical protein n=1 Tax=Methylobacterium tarhaniae TaxID=1187852 RepID=UPI0012ED4E1C|nr:hypothetical protein [Methylobacterium tarhaniae]
MPKGGFSLWLHVESVELNEFSLAVDRGGNHGAEAVSMALWGEVDTAPGEVLADLVGDGKKTIVTAAVENAAIYGAANEVLEALGETNAPTPNNYGLISDNADFVVGADLDERVSPISRC